MGATFFDALAERRAFILSRIVPKENGKADKVPSHYETGRPADSQDRALWMKPAIAQAWLAHHRDPALRLGLMIADGLVCIDIDNCAVRDAQGKHIGWSDTALSICNRFPLCAREVSQSGTGLHLFFHVKATPAHGKKNTALGIEGYTEKRHIMLSGNPVTGDVLADYTDEWARFVADYLPPMAAAKSDTEWTERPVWHVPGTADDGELIKRALRSMSGKSFTGNGASFRDLWEADADALGQHFPSQSDTYDASSADLSLANRLIWWTGGDCERTEALMRDSALADGRDWKWDREDYLRGTILNALEMIGKNPPQGISTVPAGTPSVTAADVDAYTLHVDRTDQGNANLLIQQASGNLRYVAETKQWLRWDGKRWQLDEHEVFVTTFALGVARHYIEEARRLKDESRIDLAETALAWGLKCRNKSSLDNMISLARKTSGVPISIVELDRKPYLLGVENGVVDLRTGELREHEAREDFVTKRSPVRYNPAAAAPRWEALIAQATGYPIPAERDATGTIIPGTVGRFTPRPELAHYMHKALGYSITGETREQKFFFGIGEGSNGKGLIFDNTKAVLGPYAVALPSDALMASKNGSDAERPTALAARLAGARFVVASESKEGQKLDVALVKAHTGDSEMTARRMRENPFTFAITHKIWLLTNVRPAIDHLDAAMKGRLHLVPFDRRWNRPGEFERDPALPDGDKGLMAELTAEAEGVLAWLVRGAVLYEREGLKPPAEVIEKTREYVMEQDYLGRWLATLQRCAPKLGTAAAELFSKFQHWCSSEGIAGELGNMTAFGRALRGRNIESVRVSQGMMWGLRCLQEPPPPLR